MSPSPTPKPVREPGHTKVLLRYDLDPPDPILVRESPEAQWLFDYGDGLDTEQLWRGEGERCPVTYPPGVTESSIRCELIDSHSLPWHLAQRSSI